jgi:nitroreductase
MIRKREEMEALEAIRKRRSIRSFTGEPIPREHIETIIDAGRLAASGFNHQPWDFIVITHKKMIDQLKSVAPWIEKAGFVIALVLDPITQYWIEDGSAAIENIMIAATALGYGSCWLEGYTQPKEEEFKTLLKVPKDKRLLTLIPIGVPAEEPEVDKRSLKEVLHWETY